MRLETKLTTNVYKNYRELSKDEQEKIIAEQMDAQWRIDWYSENRYDEYINGLDYIRADFDTEFDVELNVGSSYCYVRDIELHYQWEFVEFALQQVPQIYGIDVDIDFNYCDERFELTINSVDFHDLDSGEIIECCWNDDFELTKPQELAIEIFKHLANERLVRLTNEIMSHFNAYKTVLLWGQDDDYYEYVADWLHEEDEEILVESKVVDLG